MKQTILLDLFKFERKKGDNRIPYIDPVVQGAQRVICLKYAAQFVLFCLKMRFSQTEWEE